MKPTRPIHRARTLRAVTLALPLALLAACNSKNSGLASSNIGSGIRFTDIHESAGIDVAHGFLTQRSIVQPVTGGVACADYDKDGDLDVYVVSGDTSGNLLYRNDGGNKFTEVGQQAGVRFHGQAWTGPAFADLDGDSFLDLFLCGIADTQPCVLINQKDGTFKDATPGSGLDQIETDTFSVAFGDYDRDGDLDLFLTQYLVQKNSAAKSLHLWRNGGKAVFADVSDAAGVTAAFAGESSAYLDLSFTPNFTDVTGDGWLDLLITGDAGRNMVLVNDQEGGFTNSAQAAIVSEHASGAAIGDYDGDGDLDWFVSGVYSKTPGTAGPLTGNRLYANQGDGTFQDRTELAGVRDGGWGWAASFADLDNDGDEDLVQVNGYGTSPTSPWSEYFRDPSRMFFNDGAGKFVEAAQVVGFTDTSLGRGVVCADFDRDGDLDVFVANILGEPGLWRNDGGNRKNYLGVALEFGPGNMQGIGARISVAAGGRKQVRELRCASQYVSQDPAEAHFGLGDAGKVDQVEVLWPNGQKTTLVDVAAGQLLRVQFKRE